MSRKVESDWFLPVSMPGSLHLQKIADALNVPVDAFKSPKNTHVLHVDEKGTYWLLMHDAQGAPVVCRTSGSVDQPTVEEDISTFLTHDRDSPQHQALSAIIKNIVTQYILTLS